MRRSLRWLILCGFLIPQAVGRGQTLPATTQTSDPIQALLSLSDAAVRGDEVAIRLRLDNQGPTATALANATIAFDLAQARMRRAAHKVFSNQDISMLVFGSPETNRQQLASAREQVEGNIATITVGDQTIVMVRVDGQWKRSVMAAVKDWPQADVEHLIGEVHRQAEIYNALAEDVEHEKFHTPRQAAEELREQLLKPAGRPATTASTKPAGS